MSAKSMIRLVILPLAIACAAPVFAAEDPNAHQIYLAAQAGKFEEAQAMMDKVLRDHPNSGKAHFIQAELLARQGRMIEAEAELANAERLAPGLPFAKPAAVKNLKAMIAHSSAATAPAARSLSSPAAPSTYNTPLSSNRVAPAAPAPSVPWGMVLALMALVALVVFAMRAMRRKAAQPFAPAAAGGYRPGMPGQPYQPYGAGPVGQPMGAPGSGIGSNIMGGLATGAAVGAGIVAGEALMHHFTDRDRENSGSNYVNNDPPAPAAPGQSLLDDDMGGTDFGVSDGGSWDDGGGGDDWN